MWATHIHVGPTPALAAFQLFDFLAAGDFAPRQGRYTLPPPEAADDDDEGSSLDTSLAGMRAGLSEGGGSTPNAGAERRPGTMHWEGSAGSEAALSAIPRWSSQPRSTHRCSAARPQCPLQWARAAARAPCSAPRA